LSQEVINQYHSETCKLSFVLFDEIEKASDALWNLLLGILDKGTLTLGDNRKVDFSRTLIFMTSNLGAAEMSALVSPRLGFNAACSNVHTDVREDVKLNQRLEKSGMEAARRKFTPEFMNRLDKVVVFRPLGENELRRILDIELNMVQQRIFNSAPDRAFIFHVSEAAKSHLLKEGTDTKYGARHLKRAIERLLVQPMSNLIATDQVHGGDWLRVDFGDECTALLFTKEAENLPIRTMAELVDNSITLPVQVMANGALFETPRITQNARSSKRG